MVITGVPETISRTDYTRLIESLGLDIKDLRSLAFHIDSIEAEVLARNESGHFYLQDDEVAIHRISIPVKKDD